MAAGGPVDPTMPVPASPGRRGAPPEDVPGGATVESLPGAYDATVAVPPVAGAGGPGDPDDPYGSGGDGAGDDGDDNDNKKWLWGALAALGVIILGVLIALLVSGGGDDNKDKASSTSSSSSSTSSSTSTSTSSTSTTSTTAPKPGAPQITAYSISPNPAVCPNAGSTVQVTLNWATTNASGVTITVDGGNTASFGANGSTQLPFNCGGPHTYTLTANGAENQTAQRAITVQPQITPPTTLPPPVTTSTT